MEISNNSQLILQSSVQPTRPQEAKNTDNEALEASGGNVNESREGEGTQTQANRDSQRQSAVNVLERQSKQSQVEIYLAVATDGNNNPVQNETASIIESLRDVQKQNKAVDAYATYQTNQNSPVNNLSRGLLG